MSRTNQQCNWDHAMHLRSVRLEDAHSVDRQLRDVDLDGGHSVSGGEGVRGRGRRNDPLGTAAVAIEVLRGRNVRPWPTPLRQERQENVCIGLYKRVRFYYI